MIVEKIASKSEDTQIFGIEKGFTFEGRVDKKPTVGEPLMMTNENNEMFLHL